MNYKSSDHTFAICAYKETTYLEECVLSLLQQKVKTNIIICTSTPNAYIDKISQKYGLKIFKNPQKSGLASDWNFAAQCVQTPLYTLCHQDDYYEKEYAQEVLKKINQTNNFIFLYTNYKEEKKGELLVNNTNLKIKKMMNWIMKYKCSWNARWIRRRILSLGNPICCPSVTFNKANVPSDLFDINFKNAADWDAWERLSKQMGSIVYCDQHLMVHRVHEESTTTENIKNHIRQDEDMIMFERFWPKIVAKKLTKLFGLSEKSNE